MTTRTFEDFWTEIEPTVLSVAAQYGRKGYTYGFEAEDFHQEFVVWALEHEEKISEWLDPELNSDGYADRMIARSLHNRGKDVLKKAKRQALGLKPDEMYEYSAGEVEELLKAMFHRDEWLYPPKSEGRSTKAPAHGHNWVATLADISLAFDAQNSYDRAILITRYYKGKQLMEAASLYGTTESTMSRHISRAVRRMVDLLNGDRPRPNPWQGRRARSSASVRADAQAVYEG